MNPRLMPQHGVCFLSVGGMWLPPAGATTRALYLTHSLGHGDRDLAGSPRGVWLERLWLRVYCRPITDEERALATSFLTELEAKIPQEKPAEREPAQYWELCHSLLATYEFLFR